LRLYEKGVALREVPVIRAIASNQDELSLRASQFRDSIVQATNGRLTVRLEDGASVIGGGSAPEVKLPTVLVTLEDNELSAARLEALLRSYHVPIITRTERDRVVIDLRTVAPEEEAIVIEAIEALAQPAPKTVASVEV